MTSYNFFCSKSDTTFFILSFFILLSSLIVWGISEALEPNLIFSYLSFTLIVIFFLLSYVYKPEETSLYFLFIVSFFPVLLSNLYIESGGYISEQGIWGSVTNSTVRLTFYLLIFFIFSYLFWVYFRVRPRRKLSSSRMKRFELLVVLYSITLIVTAAFIILIYGSPLLSGITRFHYWVNLPGVLNRLPMLMGFSFFFLGILSAIKGLRFRYILLMIFLLSSMILFGEKFTLPYLSLILFTMAFFTVKIESGKALPNLLKVLFLGAVGLVILLVLAAIGYIYMHDYSASTVSDKLIDRALGLQGHVWYGVDMILSSGGRIGSASDLFRQHSEENPSGLVMLMWAIAPADLVEAMREFNIRFTMGAPAIAIATLGYVFSILYQAFIAFVTAFILAYLHEAIFKMSFFRILIGLVGLKVIMNVALMGEAQDLVKPLGIFVFSIIMIDKMVVNLCRKF